MWADLGEEEVEDLATDVLEHDVDATGGAQAAGKAGHLVVERVVDAHLGEEVDLLLAADNGDDLAVLVREGNLRGDLESGVSEGRQGRPSIERRKQNGRCSFSDKLAAAGFRFFPFSSFCCTHQTDGSSGTSNAHGLAALEAANVEHAKVRSHARDTQEAEVVNLASTLRGPAPSANAHVPRITTTRTQLQLQLAASCHSCTAVPHSLELLKHTRRADPVLLPSEGAGHEVADLEAVGARLDDAAEALGAHALAHLDGGDVRGGVDEPHAHGGVLGVSLRRERDCYTGGWEATTQPAVTRAYTTSPATARGRNSQC